MDTDFWKQRWQEGRIGFHQERVTPLLEKHWNVLGVPSNTTVLVPLAGKSRDMDWLAARGHRVIGVEISPLAVAQFFAERELSPEITTDGNGIHHRVHVGVGGIDLILGDAFALDAALLAACAAIYDRAAMIALPPPLRDRYVQQVYARLPAGCRGLLVTLEFAQHEKSGPPFSVDEAEVRARFGATWTLDLRERKDILADQQSFRDEGVSALATCAWTMVRR